MKFSDARNRLVGLRPDVVVAARALLVYFVERRVAGFQHLPYPGRHGFAFSLSEFQTLLHAQRVPGFKRAQLPAEAGAQGVINLIEGVGDFGDAVADVGKQAGERLAVELARLVLAAY